MALLHEHDRAAVRTALQELTRPVRLVLVTTAAPDAWHARTQAVVTEVATLHPQISLEIVAGDSHPARAAALGVEKLPTLVFLGPPGDNPGIHFVGLPTGAGFAALIAAIRLLGAAIVPPLTPLTQRFLRGLTSPMRLQIFVSATCARCHQAVIQAYRLALASPLVRAAGVNVSLYPDLLDRYGVAIEPIVVIDEHIRASSLGSWIARTALDMGLGQLRDADADMIQLGDRPRRSLVGPPDAQDMAHTGEIQHCLEAAIARLPPTLRTVLQLRELHGLSTAQTATQLQISPAAVKVRLHRARQHLHRQLHTLMLPDTLTDDLSGLARAPAWLSGDNQHIGTH